MNLAKFGIGLNAAMQGFQGGLQQGQQLSNMVNQGQIRKLQKTGMAEAEATRQAAIDEGVTTFNPQGKGGTPTTYAAGGKNYGQNRDAAEQVAGRSVDDVMDIFMRDTAPRIRDQYVAQGNMEKATQWTDYMDSRQGKKAMEDWASSYMAARSGDWDAAAKGFGEYYTSHVADGVDYRGHELTTDDDGNVTGFNIKLYDQAADKETTVPMTTDDLVTLGMSNNPQALFEMTLQQQQAAQAAQAEYATQSRLADEGYQRDVGLENNRQTNRLDLATHESNLDAAQGGDRNLGVQGNLALWLRDENPSLSRAEALRLANMSSRMGREDFALEYAKSAIGAQDEYAQDKMTMDEALEAGSAAYDRMMQLQKDNEPQRVEAGGLWADTTQVPPSLLR